MQTDIAHPITNINQYKVYIEVDIVSASLALVAAIVFLIILSPSIEYPVWLLCGVGRLDGKGGQAISQSAAEEFPLRAAWAPHAPRCQGNFSR